MTNKYLTEIQKFNSPKPSSSTQKKADQSYEKAKEVVSIKDLSTNQKDKKQNTYIKNLSVLTNLDYDKLAEIKFKKGLREIEKVIATLPENESKKEALRLTTLMRFGRAMLPTQSKEYLLSKKDASLSQNEQLELYLNVYVEAALVSSDFEEEIKLDSKNFEKSTQLAQLTGLSFEKFALIENQLTTLGLHSAIANIPDFPKKEEALKIISK